MQALVGETYRLIGNEFNEILTLFGENVPVSNWECPLNTTGGNHEMTPAV